MISIRLLTTGDAARIVEINQSTNADFLEQWAGRAYSYPLTCEQIIRRIHETENMCCFAVLFAGAVIGMAELDNISQANKSCSVCRFVLDKEYRGKGFGRQALELLCRHAAGELGVSRVRMAVFEFNTGAFKCYVNAGFRVVGDEVRPNGWKAIFMERVVQNGES